MTRERLFEAMAGIDEERLEHSEGGQKKSFVWFFTRKRANEFRKRRQKGAFVWGRWGAAAVCIGVIGMVGITAKRFSVQFLQDFDSSMAGVSEEWNQEKEKTAGDGVGETESSFEGSSLSEGEVVSAESAEISGVLEITEVEDISKILENLELEVEAGKGGFRINGVEYTPIRYEEYQSYGLAGEMEEDLSKRGAGEEALLEQQRESLSAASRGTSFEAGKPVTEEDLGEVIGVIEECEDPALVGCVVYRYASYPAEDICIVKVGDLYKFYTRCLQKAE